MTVSNVRLARLAWSTLAAWLLLAGAAARSETVAIVHARAWTLTADAPVEDATIVITDGRIAAVSTAAAPPAGARVIDASGRQVTPGLMNAATRLGLLEVNAASETVDHSLKPGVPGAPGVGFDVEYAINGNSALIQLARADGLTRAVSYPGNSAAPPFGGTGVLLHLVGRADVLERASVGVFATVGNRSAAASFGSRAAQWQAIRTTLDAAKAAASKPPAEPRSRDAAALDLVVSGKAPLAISTERASDVRQAAKLARDYGIRVVVIGGAEAWMVADELARSDVSVILNPLANLPISFDELGSRLDNAALLRKAGVTIAFSSDGVQSYNAGSSLREGAGLAVANGLPYVEGLRAITGAPAQIWGAADRQGTIAPGLDADLVVWDGDPLEPSTLPTAVFIEGREASLVTHQTQLRDRYWSLIERARAASP